MRLNFLGGILAVLGVAAPIVAFSSLFTVYQAQQARLRNSRGRPQNTPACVYRKPYPY
jgi:hypothetical protein